MGNSVYISKYLIDKQLQFIKLIDENEIPYFNMKNIEKKLGVKYSNLNEILENLVDKGLLARIERGKYRRFNFYDPYVLGTFISRDGVVAYWSALYLHGLTERFPNKVFVKTTFRKRNNTLSGTKIKFVSVKDDKMLGNEYSGYGNKRFPLTDVEMTLVDCFDQLRYSGPIPDLIKSFQLATIDSDKLIEYTSLYNNVSIIKRMGFLAELLKKNEITKFIKFAQKRKNNKYTLFNPGGDNTGEFNSRWNLRLNIEEETILDMVMMSY